MEPTLRITRSFVPSGRVDARRLSVHIRAADRLLAALCLVRFGLCSRRRRDEHRRRSRTHSRVEEPSSWRYRRRAARAGRRLSADRSLLSAGKTVMIETGGHVPLDRVDPRVIKIVDIKAPGSGMQHAGLREPRSADASRRAQIRPCRRADFGGRSASSKNAASTRATSLPSRPSGKPAGSGPGGWIHDGERNLRLGLQIHKILWGDVPGR